MGIPGQGIPGERGMRRFEREIEDPALLEQVFQKASVLFLAFNDSLAPYVLPVCFAHEKGTLYVHSAREGTKIELLKKDPLVGFSTSTEMTVISGPSACDFTSKASSISGRGRARIVESEAERSHALDLIMLHYGSGPAAQAPTYRPGSLIRTLIIAIDIIFLRGKKTG
jgi:nitroimidazol reductase NimA-like FMN-containing flavoprotein (pyridoxamine 5'-phosphate oxidase superfamily)